MIGWAVGELCGTFLEGDATGTGATDTEMGALSWGAFL